LAAVLGVTTKTIDGWIVRQLIPPPQRLTVKTRFWSKLTVRRFLAELAAREGGAA
jgi:hypothetical protein